MPLKHHSYSLIAAALSQIFCCSASFAQTADLPVTEVVVTGTKLAKPTSARVGNYSELAVLDTPLSITVIDQKKMQDLGIQSTTDAMQLDASANDAYNAVGYAEQFSIRGFALDNASAYRKDGFAIPGDASIPLENKSQIEILKGIAGFQAGIASPGGIVNYVTKRPTATPLRSVTTSLSERGTISAAVDLSDSTDDRQFAYRFNLADQRIRSYVKGADGHREFISGAFDWHISPNILLQLDGDYQHKSQLSAPGFQLFNGTDLPTGVSADTMLNDQPWAKPVDTRNSNLGARLDYRIDANWHAIFSANRHVFKRDDFTAFPYGCSSGNLFSGYCSNGDFDVYDYQSVDESKTMTGAQALLSGKFEFANMHHQVNVGLESAQRKDNFGDYVFDKVGVSNVFHPLAVQASLLHPGPASLQRQDKEFAVFAQDIVDINEQWQLHGGLRQLQIQREQVNVTGYDQQVTLPSLALLYKPQNAWSIYGAFNQGLEHGGIAPIGTNHPNIALNPERSSQYELGTKAEVADSLTLSAAIFRIKKPLEYTDSNNDFVSNGEAVHTGLELSANGKLNNMISIGTSITWLNARQNDTGDINLDGKRVTNVPARKSSSYIDFIPCRDVHVNATWLYASSKAFSPDNQVTVPGYSVFNLGTRYDTQLMGVKTTLRFKVDNVTNKFYWRDVTQALGGYLFPGAPRTYSLSAQFDF